ncbi:hypothetical protein ABW36_21245 [Achromobacter xylosoxidans]|nr:hypothetical protein ABW36_21245 [Achromobacter xylosoxidans]KOQ29108.1 hypothetical protein ABW35_04865 [Achromobacter xylosoxidans]
MPAAATVVIASIGTTPMASMASPVAAPADIDRGGVHDRRRDVDGRRTIVDRGRRRVDGRRGHIDRGGGRIDGGRVDHPWHANRDADVDPGQCDAGDQQAGGADPCD